MLRSFDWGTFQGKVDRFVISAGQFGRRARKRMLWTFAAFGLGAGSTWYYRKDIFQWLLEPADGRLSPFEGGLPVFNAPTDMLGATVNLAIKGGTIAALPVLVIGMATLLQPILPGLTRRFLFFIIPATAIFFLGGAAFAYYVMLPTSLGFLLNFGNGVAIPLITLPQYLELLTALMFWLGVVFELPLFMFVLTKMGVVSYQRMRSLRKFLPLAAFILAAIITPTFDALNQTMVAVPIILLYEAGLFLSWMAKPEDGDYLWLKSLGRGIRSVYRKILTVLKSPVTLARWLIRKVRR